MTSSEIRDSEEREILAFHGGEQVPLRLQWEQFRDRIYRIELDVPEESVSATANDLFLALQEVRSTLEARGWRIGVQGARRDTYPSGMLRDTVGARRVYVLHLGKDMDRDDLVDVFGSADIGLLGTVDEQNEFYRDWRRSVTRRWKAP